MTREIEKPDTDTSPTGEVSARQNEDGSYEIVSGDSSASNPTSPKKPSASDINPQNSAETQSSRTSPLTIGLVILTLLVATGTVAYFASDPSGSSETSNDEETSFRPYAGDDESSPTPVEPEMDPEERATSEEDAGVGEDDAGSPERETEIIVLEERVDEQSGDEEDESGTNPQISQDKLKALKIGPGAAARIKDSARLTVDPAKLRNIRFTNGETPEMEGVEAREGERSEEQGDLSENTPTEVEVDSENEANIE